MILELPLPHVRNQSQVSRTFDELGHLALILGPETRLGPVHNLSTGSHVPPQQAQVVVVQHLFGEKPRPTTIHLPRRVEIGRQQIRKGIFLHSPLRAAAATMAEIRQIQIGIVKRRGRLGSPGTGRCRPLELGGRFIVAVGEVNVVLLFGHFAEGGELLVRQTRAFLANAAIMVGGGRRDGATADGTQGQFLPADTGGHAPFFLRLSFLAIYGTCIVEAGSPPFQESVRPRAIVVS